jgi:DNA repair protein RecN (Recombination protein N)
MLYELRVKNFAIVEDGSLDLGEGLTAFTGETGAGKSLLLDAITLLLGAKAKSDLVRSGAKTAEVEGVFDLSSDPEKVGLVEEMGFTFDEESRGTLLVRREISAQDSKNRIWIQGRSATRSQLQELLGDWVEVSGQHEFLRLNKDTYVLGLIDQYGGLRAETHEFGRTFSKLQEAKKKLAEAEQNESHRESRLDYLKFQLDEFEKAGITGEAPAEEERLVALRNRLGSLEKVSAAGRGVQFLLDGGDGIDPRVGGVSVILSLQAILRELRPFANFGEDFQRALTLAETASLELHELSRCMDRIMTSLEADPAELESAESRLSQITRLKRKYSVDTEALVALQKQTQTEYEALSSNELRMSELRQEVSRISEQASRDALRLHERRVHSAGALAVNWEKDIRMLGLAKARLELKLEMADDFGPTGATLVQELFSANPGENPKSLAKVASGGELSRIMLALKNQVASRSEIGVYLFDEVDAGIGGETAQIVGARLRQLGRENQVLVVTHLAQIASKAHSHFRIQKNTENGRTRTQISHLEKSDREIEIARMLGDTGSKAAQSLARELLKRADESMQPRPAPTVGA